jgi:hypothetical protein
MGSRLVSEQPYKRPPITEAVIEMRFDAPIDLSEIQKVSGDFAACYPPPADPAHVTPASARQIVLGQSQALHQLAYQQGFFDARQWAILRARQQTQQRIGQVAGPLLDVGGVATEATQGGDTPITVDEHQPFAASAGTAGNRHDNAWNDLPAAFDRMGDPRHGVRFNQAAASKAQLQAVQIEFQALAVHGRDG